jgi:pyridoxamine 5'-phosphate oxidase
MTKKISDLRREYTMATLDVATVNADPVKQFEQWFSDALSAGVIEPNAMSLSTVNADGKPSSRIVLLKGVENGKFLFYSNHQSKKGRELDNNPACALTFFWPDIERQVRIEGVADRVTDKVAETYFQSRPRGSQVGAWASPQSAVIKDRSILEERASRIEERFSGMESLPKPHQWGGYQIEPLLIEFWQGRTSRLHDRVEYVRVDGSWTIHRLAP